MARMWRPSLAVLFASLLPTVAFASQGPDAIEWLQGHAQPADGKGAKMQFVQSLGDVRVIGLGEATHGQRECFAFKHRLTLHLIYRHGFRLVAYEASATRAQRLDDYIQGRSDSIDEAMGGFGMMIWMVEGNRALLEDLRAWNLEAEPGDRVEIIGVDVQDPGNAASKLYSILAETAPDLASETEAVTKYMFAARDRIYAGKTEALAPAQARLEALVTGLTLRWGEIAQQTSPELADEALRCGREIARFPLDPSQPDRRDRGMAQSLLDALTSRSPDTKAVLWGHNGHITKGPLRSIGTDARGCGGYLRAVLGERYFALGVAFGSGGFQALDQDEAGKWAFRRYRHGSAPAETVGHAFLQAGLSDALVNFREAPAEGPVRSWLDGSIGMRSWGGYRVPADPDAAVKEGQGLAWTVLAQDFDGLLFLEETSPAEPVDKGAIWKE